MGKAVIAVIVVVVLALGGLGWYAYGNPIEGDENTENSAAVVASQPQATSTPQAGFVVATTTPNQAAPSSSGQAYVNTTPAKPASNPAPKPSTVSYTNAYHNSVFGLTVPGAYTVTQGQNTFNGVTDTASLHFYRNGSLAFTIYVWSKEQWSKLRNMETWNQNQGNIAGTYFGEGTYLGENFRWIYSILPVSSQPPAGIQFY